MPQLRPASPGWRVRKEEQQHEDMLFTITRSLQKFRLYETRQRFYLIGSDPSKKYWRVLKIDRSEPSELNISEDPVAYTQQECKDLLQRIADGNRATGGLTFITKAFGIVGCIKFLESYYLILVTKRRQIGSICGHAIYAIDESQMITIPHSSVQTDVAHSKAELRYKKLLSGVDLTKDFYFSYTYPIMQCLQRNVLGGETKKMPYENMFVWNAFLTCSIRKRLNNTLWTIPLVHGYFEQVKMSLFGCIFVITLISRRSRHFAGTRYLKRGVSDKGRVANDVETEQIVSKEECGTLQLEMSSVVQMRGSIPLFWSQEASRLSPKPDIILQRYDPTYQATRLHFEDVAKRYGDPIIILNLIKTVEKRPREMMLRREFASAVGYLNQILPEESCLQFIHWDFHKFAKSKSANVLAVLGAVACRALDLTDFYYSGKPSIVKQKMYRQSLSRSSRKTVVGKPPSDFEAVPGKLLIASDISDIPKLKSNEDVESGFKQPPKQVDRNERERASRFQSGVLRTNCIDCLDRTNVAQYAYGLVALGRQLLALGLTDTEKLDPDSSIAGALMSMYQNMGDALALQYGGSAAHNTVFPERQGKWKATTQSQEFLKSIRRYYSNAYTDGEKQDAINLFLGYFQPEEGKPALWELDSDYYLHVGSNGDEFHGLDARSVLQTSSMLMEDLRTGVLSHLVLGKDDTGHLKLTSFDKLMQVSCGSIRNVRMCSEADTRNKATASVSGTAPDAAEIQLKSPVWLYGQHKQQAVGTHTGSKDVNLQSPKDKPDKFELDFSWLFSSNSNPEQEIFERYLMPDNMDESVWPESGFLQSLQEDNEAYQHYAQCFQGINVDPFNQSGNEVDKYDNRLLEVVETNDEDIVSNLNNVFNDYYEIQKDFGISMLNQISLEDPNVLTQWILRAN